MSDSLPEKEIVESVSKLDGRTPSGDLEDKWSKYKSSIKLVNPSNKRKFNIIVVGTGLAGASAASTLAELGYNVKSFCIQDTPRRAHSIAAQGGINAAKNYQNDGDSVHRLFIDTIKGGDYRAREDNVHRLAEISTSIIDHCVAQGVPFARDYGGLLTNRSFGGAQVSRTFYARGQTGQQLLLGAYSSMMRQVAKKQIELFPNREMLDVVTVDGKARGIIVRNLKTGEIETHCSEAVLLCTGGFGNVYFLSTNGKGSNVTAAWRCHKKGSFMANPCFAQIHPTCIPASGEYQSKLTLMSESLRNDGRVWVPKDKADKRNASDIPESDRDNFLERMYPAYGNLVPRDVGSRAIKNICDEGRGLGETGRAVYLDFGSAIERLGKKNISDKYGNLFDMYETITGQSPYKEPMKIYPAIHYIMGGLWVDYDLMSTIPGLFVLGEANFSDHGANRLGASALMQGLADGYFVIPYTLGNYLANNNLDAVNIESEEFKASKEECENNTNKLLNIKGSSTALEIHRELGSVMWDLVGMARTKESLQEALDKIPKIKDKFWNDLYIPGESNTLNKSLEHAGRLADFLELGELMALDALNREESCGAHFREEYQTEEGEPLRNDDKFAYVSAWEYNSDSMPILHKENLDYKFVKMTQRNYK
ncbi:MAG: fumarate reductase/succinate dehydrogenase flavoprotein subunit [Thermodesulfobacteriota bacterium]|jgi:succinate dehydrogenase / fumarate reductase flavoprotein subunit|nr:MAG: fumarate reductase/succinate dehydrogenase flavoprotein subunit [Candidatus Dadabacteria bacterium]